MIKKQKSWLWGPFRNNSFTTIGETIYCPPGMTPDEDTIRHESIHMAQQKEVGLIKFMFLYLFCLPCFYNPWRKKWELEAYAKGSGITETAARNLLSTSLYGWLA
jgi:hypothetical protein